MHVIDLVIIVAYLAGTVVFGAWFSRSQKDVKDYFVGGRSVPWWRSWARSSRRKRAR